MYNPYCICITLRFQVLYDLFVTGRVWCMESLFTFERQWFAGETHTWGHHTVCSTSLHHRRTIEGMHWHHQEYYPILLRSFLWNKLIILRCRSQITCGICKITFVTETKGDFLEAIKWTSVILSIYINNWKNIHIEYCTYISLWY